MERVHAPDPADRVSELLGSVRVRSSIFCRSEWSAPWGCGIDPGGHPAFHLVTSGACWLEIDGEREQLPLRSGDLVVLPAGSRHSVRDAPDTPAPDVERIAWGAPTADARLGRRCGGGAATGLLCGGFTLEGAAAPAILDALPPLVLVSGAAGRPAPWVSATFDLLLERAKADGPGSEAVLCRLADVLLVQALSSALAELKASDPGRVRALADPHITRAIDAVRRHPERAWTVAELGAVAALSRSAFGARFRELVGESPRRYCTRRRLAHAARLLDRTEMSLAEIAARSGYRSEFSFGKAFKREFGMPPGRYRAQGAEPPRIAVSA